MELVTIKVFNTEPEAQLLRVFLEANDVESFVFGNVLANTYNVLILLQVAYNCVFPKII